MGSNLPKSRFSEIRKILDIGIFYMSSISAMGHHFFHWKKKRWVRGGRSRVALSENIEIDFFRLSMTGSCPQNLSTWETHIKYALVYFLKNQKLLLILWYGVAASSFFQRFSFFFFFVLAGMSWGLSLSAGGMVPPAVPGWQDANHRVPPYRNAGSSISTALRCKSAVSTATACAHAPHTRILTAVPSVYIYIYICIYIFAAGELDCNGL